MGSAEMQEFFDEVNLEETVTNNNVPPKIIPEPPKIGDVLKKLYTISAEMGSLLIEREEIIKDSMIALLSKNHLFLYGPPGTAKSKLVKEFQSRIVGTTRFQWMLNKTTDVSEVFGPLSIKALEQDRTLRITNGKVTESEIVFIDEIFKANSPMLNMFLTVLNERVFYNDGKEVPVPLLTMFCASNEIPYEEELMALYDRIMFKEDVQYIKDVNNRVKMYKSFVLDLDHGHKTTVSLKEISFLQNLVPKVKVPDRIYQDFESIMLNLKKNLGLILSDRRRNGCFRVLQASALYEGRDTVTGDDFESLVNVLWNEPKDIEDIRKEVIKMINPFKNEFKEHTDKFNKIIETIENTQMQRDKDQLIVESKGELQRLVTKMNNTIINAQKDGRDVKDMINKRDIVAKTSKELIQKSLGFNFNSPDGAPDFDPSIPSVDNKIAEEIISNFEKHAAKPNVEDREQATQPIGTDNLNKNTTSTVQSMNDIDLSW